MNDVRTLLERGYADATPPPDGFERMLRRRDRKRRNQRITAGIVGIAVFVAAVWIVRDVTSLDSTRTVVPGGSGTTGPAETGPAVTAPETAYLIDLNTGEMTPLPKSIAGCCYAVSPDGTMVAYVSLDDAGTSQVFIARLDGTDVQQVTQHGAFAPIDWSPDGGAIAYTSGWEEDLTNIFVLDLATGETSQVTNEKPMTETCVACGRRVPPTPSSRRMARPSSTRSVAAATWTCGSCPSRAGRACCSSAGRPGERSRPMGQRSPWRAAGSVAGSASRTPMGRTCACWSAVLRMDRGGRLTARGSPTTTTTTRSS